MKISLPFYLTNDSTQKKAKKNGRHCEMNPILGELEMIL